MRDLLNWNLSLGRWAGVKVRLHVFFLLLVAFALYFSTHNSTEPMLGYALVSLLILFFSVLLHEFGHCAAAWKVGGTADQILIWPLGGLAHVNVSHEPRQELFTAVAGPAVNLAICLLLFPPLLVLGADVPALLNPLVPPPATDGLTLVNCLQLVFWMNWLLVVVNMLPAFPLDGGRALRAVLWPKLGFRTAVVRVALTAKVTALALVVAAFLVNGSYAYAPLPLALFGIFLFFAAKQDTERLHDNEADEALFGYDFSQGYTSLEKNLQTPRKRQPGVLKRWLDSRREARLLRQQQIEEEEEHRVDEVLARLHVSGRDALTDEDRALLDRVSARYRNRQGG